MASGKSTVAGWLRDAGFHVVDADELVAALYEPGEPGALVVAELLGASALDPSGAVDRPAVAERVFADDALRRRLEAAIHPLVRARFADEAGRTDAVASVLEATLLVEAGYRPDFDLVVTVETSPEVQLERAVARGLPAEAAAARLRAQGDGARRRAGADRAIRNDGTLDDLQRAVDAFVADVRDRAQRSADGEGAAG